MATDLESLRVRLAAFAAVRQWEPFHSPKNLAMALAGETGELLELFQWLTEEQSRQLEPARRDAVAMELADIQIYLIRLADQLGVDLLQQVERKIALNETRYPVERCFGNTLKYNEL